MTTDALLAGTMAEMTAPEIVAAARRGAGALLPIGVMEIHGPHLPIGTDAYIASALCRLTQRYAAEQGIELLIAPPFYWGVNHVMSAFPELSGYAERSLQACLATSSIPFLTTPSARSCSSAIMAI